MRHILKYAKMLLWNFDEWLFFERNSLNFLKRKKIKTKDTTIYTFTYLAIRNKDKNDLWAIIFVCTAHYWVNRTIYSIIHYSVIHLTYNISFSLQCYFILNLLFNQPISTYFFSNFHHLCIRSENEMISSGVEAYEDFAIVNLNYNKYSEYITG